MTTATIDAKALPQSLRRGLGKIDRKIRGLALLRGLGLVAVVMAIVAACGMALDFALPLPAVARWAIWGTWIGAGSLTLLAFALRPLFRHVGYSDLAAVAERSKPEMGERLSSAVELIGTRNLPHGSPELIEALADDAANRASSMNLSDAVSARRASLSLLCGLVLSAIVVTPSIARPDPFLTLSQRFLMPWSDVDRVSRFVVEITPGDKVVAIGSDVPVTATIKPRFGPMPSISSARLEWSGSDGAPHQAIMATDESAAESRAFRLTLPKVAETLKYRVVTDSTESRKHSLTAVEPPAVAKIVAKIEPPSYTKIAASNAKKPERIEAWEGSTITLTMTANKPVKSARLDWPAMLDSKSTGNAVTSVVMNTSDLGLSWTATVPAATSGNYSLVLEDEHAIGNRPESPRRLIVRPDAAPTITLGGSADPKDVQADDLLVVEILARDDLAVMTCDLLYAIERAANSGSSEAEKGQVAARVETIGTRIARGEASLNLKSLNLRSGDVLTYQVRVSDSRPEPKGPNVTLSGIRGLRIVDKAEPLLARERSVERQSLQDQLTALKKLASENHQASVALRYAADAAGRGNGKWDDERQAELTRREASAKSVVEKLQTLARDFADSDQFAALERPTNQIADVEAEGGRETLDAARQAADANKRLAQLRIADDRLSAVMVRLEELQRKFDELTKLDDERRKLRELAEKQEDLAKRAEEVAKTGDRGELEKVQQEQERLRWELDELAKRSPELRAEALATKAKQADDLAKRAHELAQRQREEARKTADPTTRAAKLKELAEAQKKVEDDARRLALNIDRPLEENGRARLDAGALNRAVEPLERGEMEPGRQRLEEAEATLQRLARDLEDVRDDPKAMARRLARRQDMLNNQVAEMIREARDPDQKAALADKLKPMAERQDSIAKLTAQLPVPEEAKNQAREAVESTQKSVQDLKENKNDQVQNHQNEARDRLNRLADALPDPNQRRQKAIQAMNEAKGRIDQVSRELDEHLRATLPQPNQNDFDPDVAARELARRVTPLADRQAEAVRQLAEITPDRETRPQQERALKRAQDLADVLDAVKSAAPPESKPSDAKAMSGWRILGAFDDARAVPPFPIDRPVDLKAVYNGRKKSHPTWKPADPNNEGMFNLGAMFSRDGNQSVFAAIDVVSPAKGKGRLVIGSDDTLCIWLNGKHVFEFNEGRSWARNQNRIDVVFEEGPNRLLVRSGNRDSEWAFSVDVQTPKPPELAKKSNNFQKLRDQLPAKKTDATAAVERLEQKLYGREPADDRATEMASEMKDPANAQAAEDLRAMETALRNLKTSDALPQRAEAIRRVEAAAKAEAEHRPDAKAAKQAAAEAVEALAQRLTDTDSPQQRAEALADAQQGMNQPDASRDAREQAEAQKAIANEVAALPAANSPKAAAAVEAANHAAEMAERRANRPDSSPNAEQMKAARDESAKAIAELAKENATVPQQAAEAPKGSPREQAKALANQQRELAKKADAVKEQAAHAGKDDAAAQAKVAENLAALAHDQEALGEAARDVADPLASGSQPRREAEAARDQARAAEARAIGAAAANDPAKVAVEAKAAAEALDRLAEKLPDKVTPQAETPKDPELAINAEHAQEARDLARRERKIRDRVQALMGDRVEAQEKLRDEAANLGREIANLRDGTREVSPKAQGPANAAAELLQHHAPPVMNEGAQHLAAGRADPARDSQRRAAETLERAAQQAEDIATALRAEVPADALAQAEGLGQGEGKPQQGQGEGKPSPSGLAAARDAQREASRDLAQARETPGSGEARATQAASQAMHQAANGLRAAAKSSQKGKSPSSKSGQTQTAESANTDPKEGEAGRDEAHLAELKEAIKAKTGRNWGELPGHLRSEILQMSGGKYRDDYARLIQLYFREIAAGRNSEDAGTVKP